ncbi:hypothetical protein [Thiomicrorhabdus sediminis]|uniref:Uncharacterized protein n=1 Tax=Thiomicrorhabdus sediminis TaxID=2580412 RepID=A0A4V1HHQ1_9GAMM|nr:hypothetical protein [Thiomicrorhabdus sediminis]QCU89803.1 hypothetical protein FE785_03695 [Thiomicrorhabdus sediminis]
MKSVKLIIAMSLLISHLFTGVSQAMTKPFNPAGSSDTVAAKLLAEDVHACHHNMTAKTAIDKSAHDCCDSQSTQNACPMCGEDCVCATGCHHVLSQNMLSVSQSSWQVLSLAVATADTYTVSIRPIFLPQEDIPPKG